LYYTDETLTCTDCGRDFAFTSGEQAFFAEKGFQNKPNRCPECRVARKAGRGATGASISTSNADRGSGGYSGGGRSAGGTRRELFEATCSRCGNVARVPFQPRGDRPVYCSDCFSSQRSSR
jgi:CxxC-x17-CxxC domain-containing protein